jgi:endonuclease/exonuclease/phosphatase family metal-dependent hydrolase
LNALGAWLAGQAYDVVGLNELNGWERSPDIHGRGASWGYPHAALFVTEHSPYFVGVLSKYPVTVVATRSAGFHHGLLHVRIRGVHYLITHLSPADAARREAEASMLADLVRGLVGPVVVMGDLNTLSPLDREHHVAARLVDVLRGDATLRRKFLTADGTIDYRPMQRLLDAGLCDPGSLAADQHTVPTIVNQDHAHAARMRLDYILVNAALLARRPRVRVLHTEQVQSLSDHYPVECTWPDR